MGWVFLNQDDGPKVDIEYVAAPLVAEEEDEANPIFEEFKEIFSKFKLNEARETGLEGKFPTPPKATPPGFLLSEKSTSVRIRSTGGGIGPSPKATPKSPAEKKHSGFVWGFSGFLWGFVGGMDVA